MPAKLVTTLLSVGAAAVAVAAIAGTATPAFAKSDTALYGPRTAQTGHAFRLSVWVGDDGGAKPAAARLQVRGANGSFQWFGTWQKLRRSDWSDEWATFTVTEGQRGADTFRAIVTSDYAITNTVTVVVRLSWLRADHPLSRRHPGPAPELSHQD
jgi:hypothetical protein